MNKTIKNSLLGLALFVIYLVSVLLMCIHFYDLSIDSYQLCIDKINESYLSTNACSPILATANSFYYSWTVSLSVLIIITLSVVILLFGATIISAKKELKAIEDKDKCLT